MKIKLYLIIYSIFHFVCLCLTTSFDDDFQSKSRMGVYSESAVSTDSPDCAVIGKEILELNGTAADSIIAVLMCMGVTIPESMGLGGGGLFMFYNRTTRESYFIDGREKAPKAAKKNMFHNNANLSIAGPLAIAVPGQLAASWELHRRSGSLKWERLFDGAIDLAKHGFKVSEHMANAIKSNENYIRSHPSFREIFFNKNTNQIYKENETIIQTQLANTLERLARSSDPLQLFYEKDIAEDLINDIKDAAEEWNITEIIKLQDFKSYKVEVKEVIESRFKRGNLTLHTPPLPGTGILLSFIMRVMENFDDLYPNAFHTLNTSVLFYHRLMESYKFAFAQRMELGDNNFDNVTEPMSLLASQNFIDYVTNIINDSQTYDEPSHYGAKVFASQDHGTSHVAVIDKFGNAASVSSTVNMYFGSKVLSPRTGLVLNDEMDDFSSNYTNGFDVPPTDKNLIEPEKRPLSSMCPSFFIDHSGNVRLAIGASGGTKITTSVALVAIRHLWMNEDIKHAIDWPRLHHQLLPNEIIFDNNFPTDILSRLQGLGHKTRTLGNDRGAIVMAVSRLNGHIYANSDFRKGGSVDGI